MEGFRSYFQRLVVGNAGQIFPNQKWQGVNSSTYHQLVTEVKKLSQDFEQSRRIAEAIETGTEDLFRDFDLSTFMEHFKLDAFEKTVLALAFKLGGKPDLKTKADAILSTNFPMFGNILSKPSGSHTMLGPDFIAGLLDRFIQVHPPNFNAAAKKELEHNVQSRYLLGNPETNPLPPSQVLAALDLMRLLADRPPNALTLYIHKTGRDFTENEDTCYSYLRNRPANCQLSEEQVSHALMYTTISQTPPHNPSVLVAALRRVLPGTFRWQDVVSYFDHSGARITAPQFLRLYNALLPIAQDDSQNFEIWRLWGGEWENPETQMSFVCAYTSLLPDQLDATTIPGLKPTFTLDDYAQAPQMIRETAAYAVRHPLVSEAAMSAIFNVALHSAHASKCTEAKRLFQDVVVPQVPIFVVSAFRVPKPWPKLAEDALVDLFIESLWGAKSHETDFVLNSLWRWDKDWVKMRLIDAHAHRPICLPQIFEHSVRQGWLEELVYLINGFGFDLTALAHAEGYLDLQDWAQKNAERSTEMASALLQFLMIKANLELQYQRSGPGAPKQSTTLQVRTVSAMLQILEEFLPKSPIPELIVVQRQCITAYPRLINYGEGFDDIIDANGRDGNSLPQAANVLMEDHYKKMYSDEVAVRDIVGVLDKYKHSRDPLEQDTFACMIHGLFDEYAHYENYPLEALATTAVLFGGIISHKLVSELPLKIGLGMILEAVRDHQPQEPMYKFGLQALLQLLPRLREWPGFCTQLLLIPGLQNTEARKKAEDVLREHEEETMRARGAGGLPLPPMGNDKITNGNHDEAHSSEQHPPPFTSVNVDPPPPGVVYEDPTAEAQGKIQFFLNNLTESTLQTMYKDLRDMLEAKHQQWFASHLVEERAKMQPNYHQVYLDLVKMFEDKSLWAEVLRETYVSVQRMLNSEVTLQNSTERTHLKNLGGWLGLLTLARNKPIKHRNIAFKQLLMEAHDTKRLLIVIPFVCKVLAQGASSEVFQPPNPWLMDIIHLLIELYHNAELKLNLKFEIEVLCKGLKLDHKSIEPSGEILNRAPVEEVPELNGQELEPYDNTSINGMGSVAGGLTTHASLPIPDLSGSLSIPPTEVIDQAKLHSITTQAVTRALQEIIQPVVDRSVTIAAIATQQMIHKDFATEPDENRVRDAAINMVKSTAGSLALVTSKEPLRSNMANYLRALSAEMGLVLPEGIIMLCINSNLDLASSVIEKSAEDRAVPEIEDMIQPEIEARRRHRAQRPNEPYMDPGLTRWAWTIPHPFKLNPSMTGLNAEQMAIYDDFARQPRAIASTTGASHAASTSDARSLANEVLGDQFNAIPAIPTPAETPSLPHLGGQLQHYPQGSGALANGRQAGLNQVDARTIADRVNKLLESLTAAATAATEEHFNELPRAHQVLDIIDALVQLIIKTQQTSEEFAAYAATQIAQLIFRQPGDTLLLESLVHVLETLRKIAGPATSQQIRSLFHQQPAEYFLNLPLISALLGTDLLDWRSIDAAMSMALQQRKEGSIEFLEQLTDLALLSDNPLALYADFVRSLEEAWIWISEDPDVQGGQSLKSKIVAPPPDMPDGLTPEEITAIRQDQMEYVFDEWIHLCNNPVGMSSKSSTIFVQQMHSRKVVANNEDFLVFVRTAIDKSVDRFEQAVHLNGTLTEAYQAVDALGKMIVIFFQSHEANADGQAARAAFIDSIFALIVLVLNNHHVKRGDAFNSRVFVRLFSVLLHGIHDMEELPETERDRIMLTFADRLYDMRPSVYPGFALGWLTLVTHRVFQPALLQMANNAGWEAYTKLLREVLSYHGELLKSVELSIFAKEMYQAVLKHLIILGHDFPDYVAANHVLLCQSLPPHATQLRSIILLATPASAAKPTDAFQPGLKLDQIADIKEAAISVYDPAEQLRQLGLLDILDQALQNGPSEDAIAQITHAITRPGSGTTEYGFVPLDMDRQVVDAVISHIGNFAVNRAAISNDASVFVAGAPDLKTLQMLITELSPPARYYILNSMANWLRFTSAHTHYFIQVFLDFFSRDVASTDPEEMDIRQQIVRVLLERLIGYWPYPWGLIITTMELVKNEKYNFFELPFIKSTPEVRRVFEDKVRQH